VAGAPGVKAVWLFGSFATGTATPRSDADVVIEINESDRLDRERLRSAAMAVFAEAPVPVDLFVMTTADLNGESGIAPVVRREGLRLA
jgi:predicted nucleotidyltransferase